jgi:hypothetical protein
MFLEEGFFFDLRIELISLWDGLDFFLIYFDILETLFN